MIGRFRSSSRNLVKIRPVGPFQSSECLPSSSHFRPALCAEPPTEAWVQVPIFNRYEPGVEFDPWKVVSWTKSPQTFGHSLKKYLHLSFREHIDTNGVVIGRA